jgi:hypothetical protein
MKAKKAAVGQVHAIQAKSEVPSMLVGSDASESEALGDVVADEIDDHRSRDQRQRAGGGEETELIAGGAGRTTSSASNASEVTSSPR